MRGSTAIDIIYGTIRVIEPDDETVLAWARQRWACIVFNLHVEHTAEGIAKAAADFRRLIDRAMELGGSYYLTYHRWADARQLVAVPSAHPGIPPGEAAPRSGRGLPQRLAHPSRTASRERIMRRFFIAATAILLAGTTIASAAPGRHHSRRTSRPSTSLLLKDGSRVYGQIERESDTEVVFRTTSGAALTTPRARIVSLRPVVGRMIRGEFRREDPNSTRLVFGPTARAMPRGQAYLGVYQGLAPFVQVGVTDRFSVGGGTPLMFRVDDWDRPYWVTPKLQVLRRKRQLRVRRCASCVRRRRERRHRLRRLHEGNLRRSVHARRRRGVLVAGRRRAPSPWSVARRRAGRNIKWITENYAWDGTRRELGRVPLLRREAWRPISCWRSRSRTVPRSRSRWSILFIGSNLPAKAGSHPPSRYGAASSSNPRTAIGDAGIFAVRNADLQGRALDPA